MQKTGFLIPGLERGVNHGCDQAAISLCIWPFSAWWQSNNWVVLVQTCSWPVRRQSFATIHTYSGKHGFSPFGTSIFIQQSQDKAATARADVKVGVLWWIYEQNSSSIFALQRSTLQLRCQSRPKDLWPCWHPRTTMHGRELWLPGGTFHLTWSQFLCDAVAVYRKSCRDNKGTTTFNQVALYRSVCKKAKIYFWPMSNRGL